MNGQNGQAQQVNQIATQSAPPAPQVQPTQQPNNVAPQTPAVQVQPAPQTDPFAAELNRLASNGAKRLLGKSLPWAQGSSGEEVLVGQGGAPLPAGLVNNSMAAPSVTEVIQNAGQAALDKNNPEQAPQTPAVQNPGENDQLENKGNGIDTPEAKAARIAIRNEAGQTMEFDNDQLLNMVRGFNHYNTQIGQIQEDLNSKYAGLEAKQAEIEARAAEIERIKAENEAFMNSDKGFILQALEQSPEFSEAVAGLLEENPELFQGFQNKKIENIQSQALSKTQEMNQKLEAFLKQQEEEKAEAEKRRQDQAIAEQQAFVNNTIATVQNNVAQLNGQYNLPPDIIDLMTSKAIQEVKAGNLNFDVQSITGYFDQTMRNTAAHFGNIQQQVKTDYLNQKNNVAPAPPQGGAPAVANNSPTNSRDRVRLVTSLLQNAGR